MDARLTPLLDSFRAMGWSASRTAFVHLYLNGLYWGLYQPSERLGASYFSLLQGGQEGAWDVVVGHDSGGTPVLVDGSLTDWQNVLNLVNAGVTNEAAYQAVAAVVDLAALPALPGARELAAAGIESSLAPANRAGLDVDREDGLALFADPQTSGGLLAGVADGPAALAAFRAAGLEAWLVGTVEAGPAGASWWLVPAVALIAASRESVLSRVAGVALTLAASLLADTILGVGAALAGITPQATQAKGFPKPWSRLVGRAPPSRQRDWTNPTMKLSRHCTSL